MEKTSLQACSQQSLQHDKRHVVQNQGDVKSAIERRRKERHCQRNALRDYQVSLEKDIAKLQKQLKQEVDTHKALERALTRTLGVLPRFSPGLASKVQELVAEVAVLEEEVVHLEECIAILHQGLYDEAFYTTDLGEMQKEHSQNNSLILSKEESSKRVESNHHLKVSKEKRNSVIAKLLPPAIDKSHENPSLLLTAYGEPKQKLSRSLSYRSASFSKTSTYGFCFV